jgi:hypothetical protein
MFDTSECSWSNISIKLFGATLQGLRGFSFKKGIEKEHLYAAGPNPIDIQSGNIKPEGSLKLLKYEFDKLNDAAQEAGYEDILEVPHSAVVITCSFKKRAQDPIRIIEAQGVAFTEWDAAQEQNAKMTEMSLPFISIKNTVRKGQ